MPSRLFQIAAWIGMFVLGFIAGGLPSALRGLPEVALAFGAVCACLVTAMSVLHAFAARRTTQDLRSVLFFMREEADRNHRLRSTRRGGQR